MAGTHALPSRVNSLSTARAGTISSSAHFGSGEHSREWRTFYEGDVLRYLAHMARPGGVIVDVGANIGNHAVFFAAYMAELVIAMEPAPELAALLRRNLEANAVENAIVVEAAAGVRQEEGYVVRPKGSVANAGAT